MQFQEYIKQLPISDIFKVQILNKQFARDNPAYYQNYPSLFSNAFSVSKTSLSLLNIAGYLYYQATICSDNLVDEKDLSKFPLIGICQEESIKILTSIYGLQSDFWRIWNQRRNEYLEAIFLEKELQKRGTVTIDDYEKISDLKSAFGKIAIDSLFCLDNVNITAYEQLLLSHQYFSVSFQLNDDIQDFKKDLKAGQFNWAVYLLQQQNIPSQDAHVLEKYLYIRGVSKQIYRMAISYCEKALQVVDHIDVPDWKLILKETVHSFTVAIIEIDNYLEILTSDVALSNEYFAENDLTNSIDSAIQFLKSKQDSDGSWREYINQGGISNIWATAFILSKVSETPGLKKRLKHEISKGLSFLKSHTTSNLWSYNTTWIEDSDSTSFAFLSFIHNHVEIDPNSFDDWSKFQKEDGGFSTYSNKEVLLSSLNDHNISNVDGWISTHNCVSAVSLYILTLLNSNSTYFDKVKKYFEKNIEKALKPYWWTSEIYTCYYLAKAYSNCGYPQKLQYIVDKVKAIQNENGSFSDAYGENLFYTGLALEVLLLDDKHKNEAEKTVEFLLQKQSTDGTWANSHALQVPDSQDMIASAIHFPIAISGMNVRAKEFNRLFTTTAVLQALTTYAQKYNPNTFNRNYFPSAK